MGIKGFATFLRSTFPGAFSSLTKPRVFDEVYIDLNPFLHTCRRSATKPKQVLRQVRNHLLLALNRTRARRRIYIAIDGPAPLAKFEEQRERRADLAREHLRKGRFDGQHMTPGCLFMGDVERAVRGLGEELVKSRRLVEFIVDGSCNQDEGEMKIMREIVAQHRRRQHPRTSRAFLTGDSDAYLQALVSNIPSLYLLDFVSGRGEMGNCFNSEAFIQAFDAQQQQQREMSPRQMHLDFTLLALFCGNDCMPCVNVGGLRPLWSFYLGRQGVEAGCLVDLQTFKVNLVQLKETMNAYIQDGGGLPPNLHGAIKRDTECRPFDATRLAHFILALEWNFQRLILNEYSLELIKTPSVGPTAFDLAQMDVPAVMAAMEAARSKVLVPIPGGKMRLPGANALMLLDNPHSTTETMVAGRLATLFPPVLDEGDALVADEMLPDHERYHQLCQKIMAIPPDAFTPEEQFVTFPRPAERFIVGKGWQPLRPPTFSPCLL